MNTLSIIEMLLVVAGAVTLVAVIYLNKKATKEKIQPLTNLAAEHQCTLHQMDSWIHVLIGLDQEKNRLFFIRKTESDSASQVIDLKEMTECRILPTTRTVKLADDTRTVTDKLELEIRGKTRAQDQVLEFYNAHLDSLSMQGQLQMATKWREIILQSILLAG
ncbi:MAG: hypothetical protein LWW85_00740 [Marinilabiliales bacterium]|nr:hypothetical protein [Marinilabiliales bacterium]